jgi:hypothetical protein
VDAGAALASMDRRGRYDRGIYGVLCLELWCRTFLDA